MLEMIFQSGNKRRGKMTPARFDCECMVMFSGYRDVICRLEREWENITDSVCWRRSGRGGCPV